MGSFWELTSHVLLPCHCAAWTTWVCPCGRWGKFRDVYSTCSQPTFPWLIPRHLPLLSSRGVGVICGGTTAEGSPTLPLEEAIWSTGGFSGWTEGTLVGRVPCEVAPNGCRRWQHLWFRNHLPGQRLFVQQSEFGHFLGHLSVVGKNLSFRMSSVS